MWQRFTEHVRDGLKMSHSAELMEEEIRRQLAELERQTVAFHEVIGMLRATLAIASEQESVGRERLTQFTQLAQSTSDEKPFDVSLRLSKEVAVESWRHDRLYAHSLRQVYHRLLEAKQRFLFEWHQHLRSQVEKLPELRQAPMTSLLENSLQGIVAVGVGQIETECRQELEQILEHTCVPSDLEDTIGTLPSRTETLSSMQKWIEWLSNHTRSSIDIDDPTKIQDQESSEAEDSTHSTDEME